MDRQGCLDPGQRTGHIDGVVVFKNMRAEANPVGVELKGFDETHLVEKVLFDNVGVNRKPLSVANVKTNGFVKDVAFSP